MVVIAPQPQLVSIATLIIGELEKRRKKNPTGRKRENNLSVTIEGQGHLREVTGWGLSSRRDEEKF